MKNVRLWGNALEPNAPPYVPWLWRFISFLSSTVNTMIRQIKFRSQWMNKRVGQFDYCLGFVQANASMKFNAFIRSFIIHWRRVCQNRCAWNHFLGIISACNNIHRKREQLFSSFPIIIKGLYQTYFLVTEKMLSMFTVYHSSWFPLASLLFDTFWKAETTQSLLCVGQRSVDTQQNKIQIKFSLFIESLIPMAEQPASMKRHFRLLLNISMKNDRWCAHTPPIVCSFISKITHHNVWFSFVRFFVW